MNAALRSHAAPFWAAPGAAGEWANLAFCCVARMRLFDDRRGAVRASMLALRARTSGRLLRPHGGAHSIRKIRIGAENRRLAKPSGAGFHPRRARVQAAWVDEGLPMGQLLLPPARKKKKPKRVRRRGALPTRCASRPCLFLFFFLCSSFLAFFFGGGESGFEPREGGAATESASRILAIGMPRSLRAAGVRASDFIHWENARRATRQSAPAYKTRPPQARLGGLSGWLAQTRAPGPLGMPRAAFPGASSQVGFCGPARIFRALGAAMGARAFKAAKAPIAPEIGRRGGGSPTRLVGRAPRPDRRLLSPHWPGAPSPVAEGASSSDGASGSESGAPKQPRISWAPGRLSLPPGSDRFSQRVLDQRQGRHIRQGMPGTVVAALRDGGDFPLRDRGKIHPLA